MPERAIEEYRIADEPYYLPVDHEVDLFEAAHAAHLPVILKGPTGCGKTRFVEHMAWRLERPLITVACHEDLSSTDLVGRFLIEGEETVWHDGPLTSAVRHGAICYLDEIVEARKDTVVIIHPLTDHRRRLPIEKRGTILEAPADFMLVVSYNPGYQSILKDLKQSTRQRFVAIDFDYPPPELEAEIVARYATADLRSPTNCARHPADPGRRSRHVLADHRRPRLATQHSRDRDDGDLAGCRKRLTTKTPRHQDSEILLRVFVTLWLVVSSSAPCWNLSRRHDRNHTRSLYCAAKSPMYS